MRVLQVSKLYAPAIGGVETIVQDIAEGLSDRVEMTVLVCQSKGSGLQEQRNGARIARAKSWGRIFSMPISFDFFRKFRALSKEADVIQLHAPFPLADLALLGYRGKAKVALWWHSDIVRQKLLAWLLRPAIRHTLKRADIIIAATRGNISSSETLSAYQDKCEIIPFGLDHDKYPVPVDASYLTSKLKISSNAKLLFAGRLVYYKGVDVLIDAMKHVREAELFVVGDGVLRQDLQRRVEQCNLGNVVHFLGQLPRDAFLEALSSCDAFVFPSLANSEAFGLVQLEAMRYGKPVINTNLPTGVPHVSVNGETGITVEVGNPIALAAAINKIVSDPKLRRELGRNAERRVREHYDFNKMLEKLLQTYRMLTE